MVKGDVVTGWAEVLCPRLHRLLQNGAHPFNLQLALKVAAMFWSTTPRGSYSRAAAKRKPRK